MSADRSEEPLPCGFNICVFVICGQRTKDTALDAAPAPGCGRGGLPRETGCTTDSACTPAGRSAGNWKDSVVSVMSVDAGVIMTPSTFTATTSAFSCVPCTTKIY